MTQGEPLSLRRRLFERLWVPLLGVLLLGGMMSFVSARSIADLVYDDWLADSAQSLAEQVKANGTRATLDLPRSTVEFLEWDRIDRISYDVTTDRHGRIFGSVALPIPTTGGDGPIAYNGMLGSTPIRLSAVRIAIPHSDGDTATIIVAETTKKRDAIVRSIMFAVIPFEVGLVFLTALGVWAAVRSALRSLDTIADHIARVKPDDLASLPLAPEVPREVMPLVRALNDLIARVAGSREAMSRFVANAAHQLRTPLAVMQLQTQRAAREPDPQRQQDALAAAEGAMNRLAHITNQLLSLARAEPGSVAPEAMEDVDIGELARAELEVWADAAIARNVDLGYDGPTVGPRVRGEPRLLTELMGNLVDNAIRYGKTRGRVTLQVQAAPPGFSVEDDGPGIPSTERARVLERFYRLPSGVHGTGLGLAIANEIAARHDARLTIEAGAGGAGTKVSVIFPS